MPYHGAGPGQLLDIGRVEVTQTDRFFNNNQQWSFLLSNHGAVRWIGLDWLDRTFTKLITLTSSPSPCGLSKLFWPLIRLRRGKSRGSLPRVGHRSMRVTERFFAGAPAVIVV